MSVAILGAGSSGLVAIKESLAHGLKPKCFECDPNIGGLWNINKQNYCSSVYNTTVINTSKEMMCFSDFPMPKEFPTYCPHYKVLEYFHLYCVNFGLKKYISFETRVELVEKSNNFQDTGNWVLTITDLKQNKTYVEMFNFVLLCNGHHSDPYIPHFPGHKLFAGESIHSREYFKNDSYVGKNVVVVGVGNSGCDMAVDLSRVCKQVYLVTRKGAWIFPRLHDGALPFDMLLNRVKSIVVPRFIVKMVLRSIIYKHFNLDLYGLTPDYDVLSSHPTVNDDVIGRISVGAIQVKPNIRSLSESAVEFMDGTSVSADVIAYCTGFSIGFPYLAPGIIDVSDNQVNLYKYVFPPHLKGTLAVVGCVQPLGAIFPISELQVRWAMMVFKKQLTLPSYTSMKQDIAHKLTAMQSRYNKSRRHTIQVDFSVYCDEIADLVGAKPKFLKIFLKDPKLWFQLFFGATIPPQYRLNGPHPWSGARIRVMNAWENAMFPSQTRRLSNKPFFPLLHHLNFVLLFVVVCAYLCFKYLL